MPPKEKKNSSITESEGQFKSEATDEPPLSNSESLDSLSSRRVSENTLDEVTSMASGNWGDQNGFATIRRVSDDTQNDEWSGFEENTLNQPNITTLGAVGQWSNMGDMGVPIPRDDIQAISSDFQLPVIDTGVLNKYQSAAFPQTYAPARKKSPQNIPSAHSITLGEVGQWSNMLGDIPIPPIGEGAQHNFQLASFPPINASTRRKSLHTVLPSQNVDPSPYAAMHALTRRNSLHTVLPSQTGSEETFNEQKIQVDVNKFYDAGMHNPVQECADENEPTCARIIKEEAQMDEDLKKFLERFEAPMYEGGDESDTSISFNA